MDIEERKMIQQTLALARENNKLIKKMRKAALIGRAWKIFYWIVIIGISIGAFYFLQPYVESIQSVYQNVQDVSDNVGTLFNFGGGEN